jgi:diguanylate cyclase (GGDEF)-like protein
MEMTSPRRHKVLVIDEKPDLVELLRRCLGEAEHEFVTTPDGSQGFVLAVEWQPDLILIDLQARPTDGLSTCHLLKQEHRTARIPVILVSERYATEDYAVRGFLEGCDDFVIHPFRPLEAVARVRTALARGEKVRDAHPLTGLPGHRAVLEELAYVCRSGLPFALLTIDLDQFRAYNARYGFAAGDEVLCQMARLIEEVVREQDGLTTFVGHDRADEFVLITVPERAAPLGTEILRRFDAQVVEFYAPEDRANGYIVIRNRRGEDVQVPLMTVTISCISNEKRSYSTVAQIVQSAEEVQSFAKTIEGSVFFKDRRGRA